MKILSDDQVIKVDTQTTGRWYLIKTELGEIWYPSVTTVLDYGWPKSKGLINWLSSLDKSETDEIRDSAADKGIRVHSAIEVLLKQKKLDFTSSNYSPDEVKHILAFARWWKEAQPKLINAEFHTYYSHDSVQTVGRADLLCEIDGKKYCIDIKTSKNGPYSTWKAQSAIYAACCDANAAILWLKSSTKKGWQFIDDIDVDAWTKNFKAAYQIWRVEDGRTEPAEAFQIPQSVELE